MKSVFFVLSILSSNVVVVDGSSSASSATLHVCNRGFCFTKKEQPLDPSAYHATHFNVNTKRPTGGAIDFCSGEGASFDCELFHILGTDRVDEEFEAVECPKDMDCTVKDDDDEQLQVDQYVTYLEEDAGVLELDDEEIERRISWKERPKQGRCFDNVSGYEFDCNLVEILDDGMVLIQDMRAGGVFAAQPKSNFTTKRSRKRKNDLRTPQVLHVDEDLNEDFRTNIAINMEGI